MKDFLVSLASIVCVTLWKLRTFLTSKVHYNTDFKGCMLRSGLNEGEVRGGMKEKTETLQKRRGGRERELETKRKKAK